MFVKSAAQYRNYTWSCDDCFVTYSESDSVKTRLAKIELALKSVLTNQDLQKNEISVIKRAVEEANKWGNVVETPVSHRPKRQRSSEHVHDQHAPVSSYASAAKRFRNTTVSTPQHTPVLIVKAKNPDQVKNVRELVTNALDPTVDPVRNMRETARGDVILQCKEAADIDIVRTKLNALMNEPLEVSTPKEHCPKIKIVGFEDGYAGGDKLVEALRKQNATIFTEASIVTVDHTSARNKTNSVSATLSLDMSTFKRVLFAKRVFVGWHSCRVYQQVDVLRCFKCNEYGHIAKSCTSAVFVCPLCAENHRLEECKSSDRLKCINCVRNNEKYKTSCDVNHSAMSMKCPILSEKTEKRKNNIRYKQ